MTTSTLPQVCVIGAGTMGAGIAAHLANCGFQVDLLDLTRASCQAAFDRAKALKPPHFVDHGAIARVRIGGLDEDIDWVREADWVCEAIIEKLDAKKDLYRRIEPLLKPNAMVSTNTSGLEIRLLKEECSDAFRKKFMGTHFFNPPRYLKLLELIPTDETEPREIERMVSLLEGLAGRRVVVAKDTPGFIANRFGMWAMIHAVHVAEKMRLSIEFVDAITGPFLGRPRSASFRLNDLVGMDIMVDIASNLKARCKQDDFSWALETPASIAHLIEHGALGQKTKQGFFKKEGPTFMALDLATFRYRDTITPEIPELAAIDKLPLGERVRKALESPSDMGEYLRRHLIPVLQYADSIREEISHTVQDFDRVMMWGFGWQMGPFAMIDAIGPDILGLPAEPFYKAKEMRSHSGAYVPVVDEPEYRPLSSYPTVEEFETFRVRDLGEGVLALSLKTKLGSISPAFLDEAKPWVEKQQGPFVVANEQKFFSVGFDLTFFRDLIEAKDWEGIDAGLVKLQQFSILLGTKKSVAAVHGYALGGGFEVAMGCRQVVAHPDAQIGMPEAKVGLLPGGSGTVRMRMLHQESARRLAEGVETLATGVVSAGAVQAKALGYLRPTDLVTVHPDRLIADARAAALRGVEPAPMEWKEVSGPMVSILDTLLKKHQESGELSEYGRHIGDQMGQVFFKPTSFDEALVRERDEFLVLCKQGLTLARIKHMLDTGKPLKN